MNEHPGIWTRKRKIRAATILFVGFGGLSSLVAAAFAWISSTNRLDRIETIDLPIFVKADKPGVVKSTFPIANRAPKPIAFQFQPSCGCTEVDPMFGTLEPGETRDIRFGVRLNVEGEEKNVTIGLLEGSESIQRSTIHVHAVLPESHRVVPDRIDFGFIRKNESKIIEFRIEHIDPKNSHGSERLDSVSCNRNVSVTRDEEHGRFQVKLIDDDRTGLIHGFVKIVVDRSKSIEIPILGEVSDLIVVAPRRIDLRPGKVSQLILKRIDGKPIGRMTSVEAPRGIEIKEHGDENAIIRKVTVRLIDSDADELTKLDRVRIRFDFEGVLCEAECRIPGPMEDRF